MIQVIIHGSSQEVLLLTAILKEYSGIFTKVEPDPSKNNDMVVYLEVDLRRTKQATDNLLNKLFFAQALQFFQTNTGKILQKQFEESISQRINETKCQRLRLQTLAILRKNMICEIEKLIKQKVIHIQTTGLADIPILQ